MRAWISLLLFSLFTSLLWAGNTISPQRQAELHELLIEDCGSCHGSRLLGGLGPSLQKQRLNKYTREFLIDTVFNGREGTAMPPWKTMLSYEETGWLVDQLRRGVKTP